MSVKSGRKLMMPAVVLLILLGAGLMMKKSLSLKKEGAALRSQQKELFLLRDDFIELREKVGSVEGKKSLAKVGGIVQTIDEIFRSLGLNQKVKSVKPAGTREMKYASEEEAEVQLEKVDMNEMVNILYKLENAPMLLVIKKTTVKTSFENPTLFNITLTLGLAKPK